MMDNDIVINSNDLENGIKNLVGSHFEEYKDLVDKYDAIITHTLYDRELRKIKPLRLQDVYTAYIPIKKDDKIAKLIEEWAITRFEIKYDSHHLGTSLLQCSVVGYKNNPYYSLEICCPMPFSIHWNQYREEESKLFDEFMEAQR